MTHTVVEFDALLGDDGAAAIVDLCERFARYGMYSQEHVESDIGRGLSQRHDAASNFVRTGGRFARDEPVATLAARTNYFREEYAYGAEPVIAGNEPYLFHDGFADAARTVHGRPVIEPAIVFANLMVPGQELAVHTDVPEFRGCNRKVMPQWLLVAMHHSGLFDAWRMPIATGVAWFHDCEGGEFCFYPDGAEGAVAVVAGRDGAVALPGGATVLAGCGGGETLRCRPSCRAKRIPVMVPAASSNPTATSVSGARARTRRSINSSPSVGCLGREPRRSFPANGSDRLRHAR